MTAGLTGKVLIVGGIFALLLLLYYVGYTVSLLLLTKDIRAGIAICKKSWELDPNAEPELLKIVDIDESRYVIADYVYDNYRYRVKERYLYRPILDMVKVLLLCMFLMSFDHAGFTQLLAVLVVEGVHFLLTASPKVKASGYEHWRHSRSQHACHALCDFQNGHLCNFSL